MANRQISEGERLQAYEYWREHEALLRNSGEVTESDLQLLAMMTQMNCFGYDIDKGEVIGVGPEGKWDLLEILKQSGAADLDVCLRLAGVSDAELRDLDRENELREAGVDPSKPEEVAQYDRMKSLTPDELDREIGLLEGVLGIKR